MSNLQRFLSEGMMSKVKVTSNSDDLEKHLSAFDSWHLPPDIHKFCLWWTSTFWGGMKLKFKVTQAEMILENTCLLLYFLPKLCQNFTGFLRSVSQVTIKYIMWFHSNFVHSSEGNFGQIDNIILWPEFECFVLSWEATCNWFLESLFIFIWDTPNPLFILDSWWMH